MTRKTTLFVIGFLVFFYVINARRFPPSAKTEGIYREANRLFNLANPTEKTDKQAALHFSDVIRLYKTESIEPDTTLFFSHYKKGIIHEVYTQYTAAKNEYVQALSLKKKIKALSDSICFPAYLYAGSAYYHLNQFDSAEYYFLIAEDVVIDHPGLAEKNRLFNSLGALYYESGNYRQSHNYFTRGLELTDPAEKEVIINLRINIGASAIKLGAYEQALHTYKELVKSGVLTNEIYQNMGKAYKALGRHEEALQYFKRVDPEKVPAVNNEIALSYIRLKNYDKAKQYLLQVNPADNSRINATDLGTKALYTAMLEKELYQYDSAVKHLQQSIIHLSASNFSDTSVASNPVNFSATFTSYKLFDALVEKGIVLHEMYRNSLRVNDLLNSEAAFESAIQLVNYIGQSYDTDEARFFIKNNTQNAYQGAFRICMQLAALFPEKKYLEKGFVILEKNKASVLAGGVRENRLKKEYGIDQALLNEEQKVKLEIAKLNQQAENATEDSVVVRIDASRRDHEIKLSQLHKSFEKNPSYRKTKYEEEQAGTETISNQLSPEQVVVSYAISDSILHAFVVDQSGFHYVELGEMNSVSLQVEELVAALKKVQDGYRYKMNNNVVSLYNRLLLPLLPFIETKKELIIIPDGILYFLPFEVLQPAAEEKPLLFTKIISYHFSTRLLSKSNQQQAQDYNVLGMAPFAGGNALAAGSLLPSSGEELKNLKGNIFMNEMAVKDRFIDAANHFPVVHLATHALAQTVNPSGSYVAFYPEGSDATSRLYLDELYGLQLDSVRLVIMSACETGEGKLVDGEGVMSLSRGFAYAGAQSIVTSFWKADDQSTAFIIKKFHEYIREGKKKSAALQQAKIDYLQSDALHKTPNYWAHLVLVGDPSPLISESSGIWPWLAPIGFLVIGIWVARRKKPGSTRK